MLASRFQEGIERGPLTAERFLFNVGMNQSLRVRLGTEAVACELRQDVRRWNIGQGNEAVHKSNRH